jgi:hypothetical protein
MPSQDEPLVVTAGVEEVMQAVEALNLDAPWAEVAPNIRFALPRRRAMPPGIADLPTRDYPPGIRVGLGLDIGPAMLFVGSEQLIGWDVTEDRAFDQALANVRARVAARKQFALIHERIAGVPTVAFQSREGWASSLLLLPDELMRVLGNEDGLVLVPIRDLVLRLPLDADPGFALFLLEEFADADMNALDLPLFALLDGELHQALAVPDPAPGAIPMH